MPMILLKATDEPRHVCALHRKCYYYIACTTLRQASAATDQRQNLNGLLCWHGVSLAPFHHHDQP